jgi:hypothetical protein
LREGTTSTTQASCCHHDIQRQEQQQKQMRLGYANALLILIVGLSSHPHQHPQHQQQIANMPYVGSDGTVGGSKSINQESLIFSASFSRPSPILHNAWNRIRR